MLYSEHSIFAQMKSRTNYSHVTAVTYICVHYGSTLQSLIGITLLYLTITLLQILHGMPMRSSANGMFARSGVNSCQTGEMYTAYNADYMLRLIRLCIIQSIVTNI